MAGAVSWEKKVITVLRHLLNGGRFRINDTTILLTDDLDMGTVMYNIKDVEDLHNPEARTPENEVYVKSGITLQGFLNMIKGMDDDEYTKSVADIALQSFKAESVR